MPKKKQRMAAIPGNVKRLLKLCEGMIYYLPYPVIKDYKREFQKLQEKWVKPAIKPSSGKAKARACQDWTAERISRLLGISWGKDEQIAPREMGQSGVDIRLVADAKERFPWSVECKWEENWAVPAAIRQAKANQKSGTDWLLVMRKKGHEYVVVLDAEVFFDLLDKLKTYKKGR